MIVDVCLCVQLEKALKEIQVDESEVRQAADKQLAQARELVASIEERSVQADLKLAQVQVVRADANRKLQEAEHKLQELEAREVALRRERHSLMAEYVALTFIFQLVRNRSCNFHVMPFLRLFLTVCALLNETAWTLGRSKWKQKRLA